MDAAAKLTKARAGLIRDNPFFASLAIRLRYVEDPSIPVAGTDGTRFAYNPAAIEALSLDQCKGLIAHECMHCAMGHIWRRAGRDFQRWNVAADYAINPILIDAGFTLPDGALNDPAFHGMDADRIFAALPADPSGDGDGGEFGQGDGATGTFSDAPQPAQGPPDPAAQPIPGPVCGQPITDPLTESDWKVATAQAAQVERARGTLAGDLDRATREALAARVDWRAALREFLEPDKTGFSWTRPNRRYIARGLYLPGPVGESIREIVCAVDTSLSIGPEELEQVAGEFTAMLEDFPGIKLRVVYCDADVQGAEDFTVDNLPVRLQARGGGGTDFAPVFDWVESENMDPAALVYLTDLCGAFPESPPVYPVLWIAAGAGRAVDSVPWGDVIVVD